MLQYPLRNYEQVVATLRAHKEELRRAYGVKELALVRDENQPNRHLDILVEFEEVPGLLKFLELEERLSRLLGLSSLPPELKEAILQEAVPVY